MPKNSRLKQRAHAYALAHGVSYVEAHRLLTQHESDITEATNDGWRYELYATINLDDSAVEYLINSLGFSEEWNYTGATPLHLVGFRQDPIIQPTDRDTIEDGGFIGSVDWARMGFARKVVLDKFPVFLSRGWIGPEYGNAGGLFTAGRVLDVGDWDERLMPAPESVTMQVRTHNTATGDAQPGSAHVNVGHLLWYLLNSDLDRLQGANWKASAISSTVTGCDANLGLELLRWATITDALDPADSEANALRARAALSLLDGHNHAHTGGDYDIQIDPAHGHAWRQSFTEYDSANVLT